MSIKSAILCFPNVKSQTKQYPTGLYKIASYCKDEYNVFVIDQRIEKNVFKKINNILKNYDVLCIGLSVMTGEQIRHALEISKHFHKQVRIVWGGIHSTILPNQTIECEFIDYVVIGEGENSFLNLLHYCEGKMYTKELFLSKTNCNFEYNFIDNLNNSIYVDFDKYPVKDVYFVRRDGFNKAFNIETSRGCPHKCYFCHNSIYNKPYRCISEDRLIDLIEYLYNTYGIDGIIFQEDNFFLNKNRVICVMDYLVSRPNIGWKANSRIDYFKRFIKDEHFMKKLIDSGCRVLQFGVESGSERVLRMINKKIKVSDVLEVNQCLSVYQIRLKYNFIIGFPSETIQEINKTLKLIEKLKYENPNVEPPFLNVYNPYPGTQLYKVALEYGFNAPKDIEGWSLFNWNTVTFDWYTPEVRGYIEKLSKEFFLNTNYPK